MAQLKPEDREKLRIDVLLNEYQACHRNINHFDGIRWTIGSIFIGASLTLFGISFGRRLIEVELAFVFSFLLMLIWYLYFQHVNPYVMVSIVRCHEIEKALRKMEFDIGLHKSVYDTENKIYHMKGIWITLLLFYCVVGMWLFRIALLANDNLIYVIDFGLVVFVCFWWVHFCKFNAIDWSKKIKDTLDDCQHCKK